MRNISYNIRFRKIHTIYYTYYSYHTQQYDMSIKKKKKSFQHSKRSQNETNWVTSLTFAFRCCDWSRITMSLTLHTTEIWLNTGTDSGGMKDRTHGIFLQKASGMQDTNKHNTALFISNLRFTLWLWRLTVFFSQSDAPQQVSCFQCWASRWRLTLAPGAEQAIGTVWFTRKPPRLRGWQRVQLELDVGLSLFLSLSLSRSLSETGPALLLGSRVSGRCWNPALWHVITGLSCMTV